MLGKFARVALRTPQHRLQRPLLHGVGRGRGNKALRHRSRACRSRWRYLPRPRSILLVGAQPGRDDAADDAVLRGAAAPRRAADRRRPAAHADRAARATLHLQLTPGTDAALANGLLHVAIRERLIDHDFIAARTDRLRGGPARRGRRTGPTGSSGSPACRRARSCEAARLLGEAGTAMVLTGRGPEQQSHGVDNVLAFINLTLALGKVGQPALRLRLPDRPGQRPGRARARAEGRPAARLPAARRSRRIARTIAAVWGVDRAELPAGPGLSAVRAARACWAARACGRCW